MYRGQHEDGVGVLPFAREGNQLEGGRERTEPTCRSSPDHQSQRAQCAASAGFVLLRV